MRWPFETAGQAGIDVSGNGRGCNQEFGRFDVLDVHTDASGNPDRLWVIYEVHCESPYAAALFGEVRVNEPASGAGPYAEPSQVRWPSADIGRATQVVPITVFAGPSSRQVSSVALTGPGAADFTVRIDQCSGATLAADGSCQVFARYTPTAAGVTSTAALRVTNGDATHVDVPLSGFAYGGTTRMDLQSDPGDFIGGGSPSSYDNRTANIQASGTRQHLSFYVTGNDGTNMGADFVPGNGDVLATGGTYVGATRYPGNNQGVGLDVSGNGRGCNALSGQFTVTDLNFDPLGNLQDAGVSFVQHCENGVPALRGSFQWRAQTPAILLASNLMPPTVTGEAGVGATLAASPGTWDDPSTRFAYQWERCTPTACTAIPGATGPSYAVAPADAGTMLAVEVNLTNAGGQSAFVASGTTAPVPPAPPRATGPPVVVGSAQEGVQLGSQPGSWTGAPTSHRFQWFSCDAAGANCAAIGGATGSTYTPGSQDVRRTLRLAVSAVNAGGTSAPESSGPSPTVAPLDAPVNSGAPQLTGQPLAGATMFVTQGTWSNGPTSYGYQWLRCDQAAAHCQPVPGAGSGAYPVTAADAGFSLRAAVVAANDGGASAAALSNPSAVVVAGPASKLPPAPTSDTPFTATLAVGSRQSVRSVAASGLAVTVGCSQACTVSLSARGAKAANGRRPSGATRVVLSGGAVVTVRLRVHGGRATRMTLTETAVRRAGGATRTLRRQVVLH